MAFNKTSILSIFQVVSDPPILGKQTGWGHSETRQTSPSFAITSKNILGRGSGEIFVITEAQLAWRPLCMLGLLVYIWSSLQDLQQGYGKRTNTYNHIFVIVWSVWTVFSLIGPKSLLKLKYHTSFVKIWSFTQSLDLSVLQYASCGRLIRQVLKFTITVQRTSCSCEGNRWASSWRFASSVMSWSWLRKGAMLKEHFRVVP